MQDSNPPEENSNDLETMENSVYTDDYQTEDAFSQIPALNEFVEEETQEISSVSSQKGSPSQGRPAADAFPAIGKLQTFREKPKKQPRARKVQKEGKKREKAGRKAKSKPLEAPLALALQTSFKALSRTIRQSSRQIALVSIGTVLLSACLVILGFISLHV